MDLPIIVDTSQQPFSSWMFPKIKVLLCIGVRLEDISIRHKRVLKQRLNKILMIMITRDRKRHNVSQEKLHKYSS
ncbi:unnamed protein product [Rhizophagus irregularis]|nr:unnamed protein product [Rhizophagus irregularis]CAB5394021.1 unnamed protein product [Rhizophagus irregularis]